MLYLLKISRTLVRQTSNVLTGAAFVSILFSCTRKNDDVQSSEIIAFVGATIIDGSGAEPIKDGILVIKDGKFEMIGSAASTTIPAGATTRDLSGKFIMPGIINGHGHVGETKGIEGGHYSKENVLDNLEIYSRYGVTTVVSLGGDQKAAESVRQVNDSAQSAHARLFIAGAVINGATPSAAAAVVDSNAHMGVDIMKIRVDDNLGASPKMSEDIYKAVISRSHELGFRLAAHMYYLDDAQKLVAAGADMLAHSIRDTNVPGDFVQLLASKRIPYCPTLTRELSTFVYASAPAFFADPFFRQVYDSATVAPLKDASRQKQIQESKSAMTYKTQLAVAKSNLKLLADGGVPVVFGTDSGVPTRFMGYFEHLEMEMMQESGLTPMQIIVAASKNAAEYLGLKNLGVIGTGNWADFLILDADPLQDIRNTRKINAVFVGGNAVFSSGN
ncbi:amidohydrolase family protein [Chryseolinea sp. T2]|uniref:amidohydrolase family protein n=1 Tax=Chryseolinea sp. T2 TaxID=3129255 RepID=UPI0030778CB5